METQNNILIPIDFTEQSVIALRQSYNLAKSAQSTITLLHVLDKKASETDAHSQLNKLAEEVRNELNVAVETRIAKGKPVEKIVEAADEIKPRFIVMGHNNLAAKVVLKAGSPIITVKGKARAGFKTIVLPIELTKETRQKTGKAVDLAKLCGAEIKVLVVADKKDKETRHKLVQYGTQIRNYIVEHHIQATLDIIDNDNYVKSVIDFSNQVNADLLMIMTQEDAGFMELFTGTPSQQIVNNSERPVLSIKPKEVSSKVGFVTPY